MKFYDPRPDPDNCKGCPLWDETFGCIQNPMDECPSGMFDDLEAQHD